MFVVTMYWTKFLYEVNSTQKMKLESEQDAGSDSFEFQPVSIANV